MSQREYVSYWDTDAPLTQELELAQMPRLELLAEHLSQLERQGVRIKRLEVWVDGVEWEYRRVDATTFVNR